MSSDISVDNRDLLILKALQDDAWLTHAQIGERVNLSPSAVQRRIERLRDDGVLTGARASVDLSALTGRTRMYFLIELHNDGAAALDAVVADLKSHPEIVEIDLLAGRFDLLLIVECANTEEFFAFAMDKLNTNENVRHCWSLTRLKKFA